LAKLIWYFQGEETSENMGLRVLLNLSKRNRNTGIVEGTAKPVKQYSNSVRGNGVHTLRRQDLAKGDSHGCNTRAAKDGGSQAGQCGSGSRRKKKRGNRNSLQGLSW
jgi:hypothetical protein